MRDVKLYRIHTEDKPGKSVVGVVGRHFDGFTLLHGTGVWQGEGEGALVIEILGQGEPDERDRIEALCYDLKEYLAQEAVLLAVIGADSYII